MLFPVQLKEPKGIYGLKIKALLVRKPIQGHYICSVRVWEMKWSDASKASAEERSVKVGQDDEEEQLTWPGSIKQLDQTPGMPQPVSTVFISRVCDGKYQHWVQLPCLLGSRFTAFIVC